MVKSSRHVSRLWKAAWAKATEFSAALLTVLWLMRTQNTKKKPWPVAKFLAENMARESFLTGSGLPAWKIGEVDTSGLSPVLVQQAELIKDATGFVAWWDIYLQGADAETHKDLVSELLAAAKLPKSMPKQCKN